MKKDGRVFRVQEGRDFSHNRFVDFLNETFICKKSGEAFTVQDVEYYIRKGKLPKYLGGNKIIAIKSKKIGMRLFRIIGEINFNID